ncbi:hypothetical protein JRO89_XS15G0172400 [Xanthoceras sorbifolium]|uniref:FRIGIDA-like protein n=1 Tax=Xanthoceras sorbifolium TaxID=99658 RepID=A0ABQ8H2R2_9ROSI|nr:hypothetical protein JRO89_XS15G0172400 [Xanthoceras sorbifolium]
MATLETIACAIKQIDTKKDDLKKAYDDLQSHSSLLSSFSLSWSDLDAHFTHIQSSLTQRFHLLESLQSTHPESPRLDSPTYSPSDPVKDPPLSTDPPSQDLLDSAPTQSLSTPVQGPPSQDRDDTVVARSELRTLCEKMDGRRLIKYINDNSKDRDSIRVELPVAIRGSPDPGLMILDAMEVFYGPNDKARGDNDPDRRSCVLLLEVLMGLDVNIENIVKERAKKLALEWKEKVRVDGESILETLGFLHLVAAYGLGSECKAIGLGDKVQDLIEKLIDSGKQLLAVKYIFEFELTDKYPPVPLLKAYVNKSKKLAKNVRRDGKNSPRALNDADAKEVNALKAVVKVIEAYNLESECPKEGYEKRIEQLERQKADKKRPAAKPQQQPKKLQQYSNKRPRTAPPVGHAPGVAGANSTFPLFRQPHVHPANLPENSAAYLNSVTGPFGFVGSSPAIASYAGSPLGPYGLTGAPMGLPGNSNHALYSSESRIPPGYYDRSTAYGEYGVPPQYHPSYYPQ